MNSKNAEIYKKYLIEEKASSSIELEKLFTDYKSGTFFKKQIPIALDDKGSYGINTILGINFEGNDRNVDISIACLSPNSNFTKDEVEKIIELINHLNQVFIYEKLVILSNKQIILQSCLDIKEKLNPNVLDLYIESAINCATRANREIASILLNKKS